LKAEGYHTNMSPPSVDGVCEIRASRGSFGFNSPRNSVQVKYSDKPAGVNVLQEMDGVVTDFGTT
jgi:restriction system protein